MSIRYLSGSVVAVLCSACSISGADNPRGGAPAGNPATGGVKPEGRAGSASSLGAGAGTGSATGGRLGNGGAVIAGSSNGGTQARSCADPLFIDGVTGWVDVVVNGGGMDAIRAAIGTASLTSPTRIKVQAGTYNGRCLDIEDQLRTAAAPLWLLAEGAVEIACDNGNGQAILVTHSSYVAIDGFTIGPEQGFYGDSAVHVTGKPINTSDPAFYGQWEPSHHILVRNLLARNLRAADDTNPDAYESGCCDGIKFNQCEDVWALNNRIQRTARHGIDNVGVHRGVYCHNELRDMVGAGMGMEAKGGSEDILFEGNLVYRARHRALMLGGEGTNNNFMWPATATYEGTREVARNNLFINAAEGGFSFYGCHDCAAVGNTVWVTPGYTLVTDRDMVRFYASILEGGTFADQWGEAKRAGEVLGNQQIRVADNFFGAAAGDMTCTLNADSAQMGGLVMDHNLWWNGGQALPDCGSGASSLTSYPDPSSHFGDADPKVTGIGSTTLAPNLTPVAGSPLIGAGLAESRMALTDQAGKTRPAKPTLGALEP